MAKKNVRDEPLKPQVSENEQMSDIVFILDKMELILQAVSKIGKDGKYSTVPADKEHSNSFLKIDRYAIDGFQKLFTVLSEYRIQMCQFHMVAIIRRKLTKNPQLEAGKELLDLAYRLKDMNESAFVSAFEKWKRKWHDFLKEKTVNEITGRTIYTHQRLRSAMVSISTYLPFLFTYEKVRGMPNTNNMIEGTFTDMKKALRNHPGMIEENRKRMMNGFFLAYAKLHNEKGDNR